MSMSRTDEGTTHSAPGTGTVSDERLLAVQLFSGTWRLLKMESRTGADADLMLHMAHASRFHRAQVPAATPAHYARGEWLISRVYAVLGRPEPALYHARRVLDICAENGIGDRDLAFACGALARARGITAGPGCAPTGRCRPHAASPSAGIASCCALTWRPSPARSGTGSRPGSGSRRSRVLGRRAAIADRRAPAAAAGPCGWRATMTSCGSAMLPRPICSPEPRPARFRSSA